MRCWPASCLASLAQIPRAPKARKAAENAHAFTFPSGKPAVRPGSIQKDPPGGDKPDGSSGPVQGGRGACTGHTLGGRPALSIWRAAIWSRKLVGDGRRQVQHALRSFVGVGALGTTSREPSASTRARTATPAHSCAQASRVAFPARAALRCGDWRAASRAAYRTIQPRSRACRRAPPPARIHTDW